MAGKSYEAGGTIRVSRFVQQSDVEDHTVLEADANDVILGVAQAGGRIAPLNDLVTTDPAEAAQDGETLYVHCEGEQCLLEYGGTVTRGQLLASDADGKAVTAASGENVGAIAEESGVDGDIRTVTVRIQTAA